MITNEFNEDYLTAEDKRGLLAAGRFKEVEDLSSGRWPGAVHFPDYLREFLANYPGRPEALPDFKEER